VREARIGSVPWFAGVFWFGVGELFHGAAWAVLYVRDGLSWLILKLIAVTEWCLAQAMLCAKEAGAEDD